MNLNVYKDANLADSLSLNISSYNSPTKLSDHFSLVAAGDWLISNNNFINKMVEAREHNSKMFFSRFIGSSASMEKYLLQGPLTQPNHILFLILDFNGTLFGHLGLKFDAAKGFEVDNVMKILSTKTGLMGAALKTLLTWVKNELCADSAYLKVLSTNSRAIKLYTQLGFVISETYSLRESNLTNGLNILEPCSQEDSNISEEMYVLNIYLD